MSLVSHGSEYVDIRCEVEDCKSPQFYVHRCEHDIHFVCLGCCINDCCEEDTCCCDPDWREELKRYATEDRDADPK